MSGYAYQWAKRQRVGDSSTKTLLKTYAHWASEDYSTWVTNDELISDTELDIKTVRKCRDKLIALGFLIETTRRMGETRSVIVYQLIAPEGSTLVQSVDQRTGDRIMLSPPSLQEYESKTSQKRSPSKSGTPKGDQKRSPSKNGSSQGDQKRTPSKSGAPPDLPESPSTFPGKPLQISPEAPPNLDPKKGLGLPEVGGDGFLRGQTDLTPDGETENDKAPSAAFERFWEAWPSASGRKQARGVCESHWTANGLDVHAEVIIAHVKAMKLTQHWCTGGDPTPIRYLEQRRWLDGEPGAPEETGRGNDGLPWYESSVEVIEARGAELCVRARKPDEAIAIYRVLVVAASREKAAVDFVLRDARRFNSQQLFEFAVATFGDELLPTDFYAS
jgi:hypothetical protein